MTHRLVSVVRLVLVWSTALACLSPALVRADDPPAPPPPQHEWVGKGQFGFLDSKGNSDAESINGAIDLSRVDDAWKNSAHLEGLYGRSAGITSAQRVEAREQTDYAISDKLFAFGGLRYENDKFDGFQYQASITGGIGYKFLALQDDQLTAQVGAGYRRLRPETIDKDADGYVYQRILQDTTGEAIATVGVDYLHKFNASTTLTNKFLLEYGSDNTLTHDEVALAVKMSSRLSLAVGYAVTRNSSPPAPLKKVDTVSTVNLVFAF
jgi:putative salt-induced outer membrane protein